jgi:hypothetical protein
MRWSGHNSNLVQRINRRLCLGGQVLKTSSDGSYVVRDFKRNVIVNENVNPRELATELGLLHGGWKRVRPE